MKRVMFILAGVCWFLFAAGFGFFLIQYVRNGAGLQIAGPLFSSGSVLMGVVHVIGFSLASWVSFAIGVRLCAHGMTMNRTGKNGD